MAIQESISLDIGNFLSNLGKLQSEIEQLAKDLGKDFKFSAKVDADTKQAKSNISKLEKETEKLSDKKKINLDTGSAEKELSSLSDKFKSLTSGSGLGDGFIGGLAGGAVAGGIGLITSAITNGIGSITEFSTELSNLRKNLANTTNLTGDSLDSLASRINATAQTFGEDSEEIARSAQKLAAQTGEPIEQVLNNIQKGFINGANASGELTAVTQEYGNVIKEVGGSSADLINILQASEQQGVFSDKGIDVVKEFGLRIRELPSSTQDALEGIGISATQVQKDLESGNKSALDVLAEVSGRLGELPASSAAVGTAIADIFGGPGEDAGLAFLTSLQSINSNLGTVNESTSEFATTQEKALKASEDLNQVATSLFGGLSGGLSNFSSNIKILFAEFLNLVDITGFIDDIKETFAGISDETKNLGKLVGGIIGGGILVAFKSLQETVSLVFSIVVDAVNALGDAFSPLTDLLFESGESASSAGDIFNDFSLILGDIFDIVKEVAGIIIDGLAAGIKFTIAQVTGLIKGFTGLFSSTEDTAKATDTASTAFDSFRSVLLTIKATISGLRSAFGTLTDFIADTIEAVTSFNPSKISDAISNFSSLGSKLSESFQEGFEGSLNTEKAEQKFEDLLDVINNSTTSAPLENLIKNIADIENISDEQRSELASKAAARINELNNSAKEIAKSQEVARVETQKTTASLTSQAKETVDAFANVRKFLTKQVEERSKTELSIEEKKNQELIESTIETANQIKAEISGITFNAGSGDILGLQTAIDLAPSQIEELRKLKDESIAILQEKNEQELSLLNSQKQNEKDAVKERFDDQLQIALESYNKQNETKIKSVEQLAQIDSEFAQLQTELLKEKTAQLQIIDSEFANKERERAKEFNEEKILIENNVAKQSQKIKEDEVAGKKQLIDIEIQAERQKLADTASILQQAAGLFKQNTLAYKALAIGEATISTFLGATNALGQLPFPLNFVQAGIITATGLANVAKIAGVGFKEGGFTGNGGVNDIAGVVHGKEYVANAGITKREKPLFEFLEKGKTSEDYFNWKYAGRAEPVVNIIPDNSSKELIKAIESNNRRLDNFKINSLHKFQIEDRTKQGVKIKKGALSRL